MRHSAGVSVLALAGMLACAGGPAAAPELKTDDQKTLYALGIIISNNLVNFNLTEADLDYVLSGVRDGVLKKEPKANLETYGPKVQELAQTRATAGVQTEKTAGAAFLDKAAAEKGAVKTPTGFVYQELTAGTGPQPTAESKVRVHYRGTNTDGTEFDSSYKRNEPAVFPLNQVISCWTQALQMMKVGGKAKLVCPAEMAYGDRGRPPVIKPGATLVFEVELLAIEP